MSGAEPMAILGAISAVIAIFETSKEVYDAVKDAKGLHESFRKASDNVAIILSTLYQARLVQEQAIKAYRESDGVAQKMGIEEESRAVKPIMNLCKTNAEALSHIFTSIARSRETSWMGRYANAIGNSMPSKKRKVQSLMRETMESLQLLHTYHSFSTMTTMGQLQAATKQLPTQLSVSEGVANRQPFRQGPRRTHDASFVTRPNDNGCMDSEATNSPREEPMTLDQDSHNVWMNASGTKVSNQIGTQTVYGSQNFTL